MNLSKANPSDGSNWRVLKFEPDLSKFAKNNSLKNSVLVNKRKINSALLKAEYLLFFCLMSLALKKR